MFERGPHGYWFEGVIWDEIAFTLLGAVMVTLGIYLFLHEEKLDFMAPIVAVFLFMPGCMFLIGPTIAVVQGIW